MASTAAAAFDVFMDARGMVTFYMFIMEEASQTIGIAAYLAHKAGNAAAVASLKATALDEIITPAKEFTATVGLVAFPMNQAFAAYFSAAEKVMEFYGSTAPPGGE